MRPLALLLALSTAAALPSSAEELPVRTAPIEVLKSHHLAVRVKINGKGPYRMIFDTGAPITIISPEVARETGVVPRDAQPPPMALFNALGQFSMQRFEVGGQRADKIPAIVMDHPAVAVLSRGQGELHGIVGFSFFARYRMTLDYQAKQLSFTPNGYVPDDFLELMMAYMAAKKKPPPRLLDPAGMWGFAVSKADDDEEPGVIVDRVRPDTPAASAGLKVGDRLLTLDGAWTDSAADCHHAAGGVKPGIAAPLKIRRGGKEMTLMVTPRMGL